MFEQINVTEVAKRRSDRGNHAWLSASAGSDTRVENSRVGTFDFPAQHIWQACDRIPMEGPFLNEASRCGMDKKVWM